MARIGIQFKEVEKAALELQGLGRIPTIDGIREILGTGSRSTIATHLKAWRNKQTEVDNTLPHELAALVTGLWKKLQSDADQRIEVAETACHQQIQNLNQAISRLQQEQITLKNQLHQSEEATATEHNQKEKLEKKCQQLQYEHLKVNERYQSATEQLAAAKAENTRLHQLTKNIQSNLEHYQEQMQKHQTEQALRTEKQQAVYQQEIALLKQQLVEKQRLLEPLEREQAQLQTALEQLHPRYQEVLEKQTFTQQRLQAESREKSVLLERQAHTDTIINTLHHKMDEITVQLRQVEKNEAILQNQNKRLEKDLTQAQDKVKSLRHEKLLLIQEKSQLEGYLKTLKSVTQQAQPDHPAP